MRLAPLQLPLILIASGIAFAQNAVTDWFPTHAGAKWIYEHETRDDAGEGRAHLEIHRWKPRKPSSDRGSYLTACWSGDESKSQKVLHPKVIGCARIQRI